MLTITLTRKDGQKLKTRVVDDTPISIEPLKSPKGAVRLRFGLDYEDLSPKHFASIQVVDSTGVTKLIHFLD